MRVTVLNRAWLVATGLAAVVALPATPSLAQSPGNSSGGAKPGAPQVTAPSAATADAARAEALLRQSREALEAKNVELAIARFRDAAAASARLPQMRDSLTATANDLMKAGVNPALLAAGAAPQYQVPPTTAQELTFPGAVQDRKLESIRLTREGYAALQRGDIATAVQFGQQAANLGVPETLYGETDPRPSVLLSRAAEATAKAQQGVPVMLAGGVQAPAGQGVALAGGVNDFAGAGAVRPVQGIVATGNAGEQLFQDGMKLLAAGDTAAARDKFLEAWKYKEQLSPQVFQQLKDKLTLMQPESTALSQPTLGASPLDTVDQQQQAERQRLYREISNELDEAQKMSTSRPLDALDRIIHLRRRVSESQSDAAFKQQMLSIVDRAYTQQQRYVEENRASIDLQLRNEQVLSDLETERTQRRAANDQIAQFVEEFNQMMRERRYHEAETIAKKVQTLAPDTEIATQMMTRSRVALRGLMYEETQLAQEATFVDMMLDVERGAVYDPTRPLQMPDAREWDIINSRRLNQNEPMFGLTPAEDEIRKRLGTQVDVRFTNRPLNEVLNTLSTVSGIPFYIDEQALAASRVNLDESVTLDLHTKVQLKSALKLILDRYDLTWMIEDEVLKITSPERKRNNLRRVAYRVADLVVPIPNFVSSYDDGLAGALRAAYQQTATAADVRIAPMSMMDVAAAKQGLPNGQMNPNALAQYGTPGGQLPGGIGGSPNGLGGGAIADFDSLINLIQTTIEPDTWDAVGGPSTMAEYRANLSLVVSTTTDVHEQIADLLASLRRLQNLQVTIEVRFISLSDTFFERIGIDFDVAFDDNVTNLPPEDRGPSVTVGLSGANRLLTSDLDVQFNQGTFGPSSPAFGNFTAGQGGQIGFAILSDIEAFFFLEAAQGDSRSNVMQAPKVTMFDGQTATINDTTSRPFVMGIEPVVGDFAVAQQPVVVVLNEGTQLNVQSVVSDDKRFVRLTLVPQFTQIVDVDTFTYEGSRRTTSSAQSRDPNNPDVVTNEDDTEEIVVGTTVQQPSFSQTSVSTTVSVPDGGTILLGGIKRLRENRNEFGIPMLSKIPYVNRLFRNVGIGREATSLMMMVTPRIIIQEEEEVAQTGFDPTGR